MQDVCTLMKPRAPSKLYQFIWRKRFISGCRRGGAGRGTSRKGHARRLSSSSEPTRIRRGMALASPVHYVPGFL
jgi:hypothetical protein